MHAEGDQNEIPSQEDVPEGTGDEVYPGVDIGVSASGALRERLT